MYPWLNNTCRTIYSHAERCISSQNDHPQLRTNLRISFDTISGSENLEYFYIVTSDGITIKQSRIN